MSLLPSPIASLFEKQFLRQLVSTPRGRATLLMQVARSEGTDGETGVFEHILASVDDDEVKKLVRVHQSDEHRHEQLFLARAKAQGEAPLMTPPATDLMAHLDRQIAFQRRPVRDRHGVFEAYLLLQVLEERALRQFGRMMDAFASVGDDETVAVFAAVAADEERHLKYCLAITTRYAPSEAARREGLEMMRRLERAAFEETQRANFHVFVDARLVDGPVWRFLLSKIEQRFGVPDLSLAAS